ncbi:MAG: hypothetical protein PHC34_00990 [Candidatus Gastranaerophilales bacterium]|nr:hypothetical protein [Candidatus Gastranaerophilales bacterium]
MLDNVILVRNIFYKCFLIGFVCTIFSFLFYLFNPDFLIGMMKTYYKIEAKDVAVMIGYYFIFVRIALIYFMLIPALALHWTSYILKKAGK